MDELTLESEIVLIDLEASEDFRVTDLQALAYAGAYAVSGTEELARTLRRYLERVAGAAAQQSHQVAMGLGLAALAFDALRPSTLMPGRGRGLGSVASQNRSHGLSSHRRRD